MCSSVLGPAMVPPLVTWPTTNTAVPLSLANRIRWAAHSRTLPDAAGRALQAVGVHGLDRVQHQQLGPGGPGGFEMASRRVSPRTSTGPASSTSRSARSRICSGDSSPLAYNTGGLRRGAGPRSATAGSTCDARLSADQGHGARTIPPPMTKSNSGIR
jgi:hypothetical protein